MTAKESSSGLGPDRDGHADDVVFPIPGVGPAAIGGEIAVHIVGNRVGDGAIENAMARPGTGADRDPGLGCSCLPSPGLARRNPWHDRGWEYWQPPSLPGPGPAHDTTREKQIPFRRAPFPSPQGLGKRHSPTLREAWRAMRQGRLLPGPCRRGVPMVLPRGLW